MNYNYNPYQYGQMYGSPYGQMQMQPPRQRNFAEFLIVNSFEEVKNHIMNANQTVIFKDTNTKILYEKKTDAQGISEIKAYQEIDLNAKTNQPQYVTVEALNSVINDFNVKINNLSQELYKNNVNKYKSQILDNGE